MKIPTYEEVHTSNLYFGWFLIYSFFDAFVGIIKWSMLYYPYGSLHKQLCGGSSFCLTIEGYFHTHTNVFSWF